MKYLYTVFFLLVSCFCKAHFVDTIRIPIITNGVNKGYSTVIDTAKGIGSVTSVGFTMPNGFSVSNSPITTNGSINVTTTLNGVVKGNGTGLTTSNVDLTTEVTNVLPITNGGTNANSANSALNNLLPSQTGNANKVLTSDGSNTSWILPDNNGTIIQAVTAKVSADQTTTSSTLGDLTGTSITVNTQNGSFILICVSFSMSNTSAAINRVALLVDGVVQTGLNAAFSTVNSNDIQSGAINTIKAGLSAGSHTFKLQWDTTAGTLQCRPNIGSPNLEHASINIVEIRSNS